MAKFNVCLTTGIHLIRFVLLLSILELVSRSSISTVVYGQKIGGEKVCRPTGACSCEMSDGSGKIDLRAISSNTNTPRFKNIKDAIPNRYYTYFYNPCKAFSLGNCKNVKVCQVYMTSIFYPIGTTMSTKYDSSKNSLTFIYATSPPPTPQTPVKYTYINLVCDQKADKPTMTTFQEKPTDHYHSTLTSKYACLIKTTSTNKKEISLGTILCILLLVFLVLYLAVGIVFNKYHKQKQGSELVPNVGFWRDFPSLVKDGCLFSWRKVRGKSSEYEQIGKGSMT